MSTLSGAANRVYAPEGRIIHEPGRVAEPVTIKFPAGDADSIAAGATVTIRTSVNLRVTKIQADIPAGCIARLTFDGTQIHSTTDGDGNVGSLDLGDMAAGMGKQVQNMEITITNNNASAKNARYYVIGLP